jgi:ankyrin repeat protein
MPQWHADDWPSDVPSDAPPDEMALRLINAASDDSPKSVLALLARGVPVDAGDDHDETALQTAARNGRDKMVRLLLDAGAQPGHKDKSGVTPAHYAGAFDALVPFMSEFEARGASLHAVAEFSGWTPLVYAVRHRCLKGVRALLARGADTTPRDKLGLDALLMAVGGWRDGRPQAEVQAAAAIVEELIRAGARVDARDNEGRTALHHAAAKGAVPLGQVLLRYRADRTAECSRGLTPMQTALLQAKRAFAEFLLAEGAPLDFLSAVCLGRLEDVRSALTNDASLANFRRERVGHVLGAAVHVAEPEMVGLLLSAGADANGGFCGPTLVCAVGHRRSLPLARLLVEAGAAVDAGDADNNTPLQLAAREGDLELARFLLDSGADVNSETYDRRYTPIMFAKTAEMRELLASRGGKPLAGT